MFLMDAETQTPGRIQKVEPAILDPTLTTARDEGKQGTNKGKGKGDAKHYVSDVNMGKGKGSTPRHRVSDVNKGKGKGSAPGSQGKGVARETTKKVKKSVTKS